MSSPYSAEPLFGSYWLVALIVVTLAALLFVGPQFGSLSPRRKWVLVGLRTAVILLLALLLLRPTWVHEVKTAMRPSLLLLFDTTRSMNLPSGIDTRSRWDVQRDTLQSALAACEKVQDKVDVRVFGYDSALHPLNHESGQWTVPSSATGEQTDIGTPLAEAVSGEMGKRLAAVFLMGDGVQTAYDPRVESHEAVRRLRDDFAAPLLACAIGPSADVAQGKDVAVERLDEQFTVFVKNELTVKALVRIRGYVQKDIPVELQLETIDGKRRTIAQTNLRSTEDGRQLEAVFRFTPQETGHFRLHVEAPAQQDEIVTKNNLLTAYLTVLEGGLRVLYVEGEKRFEHKFVRQAIMASPDIELDDRQIDRRSRNFWPLNVAGSFGSPRYDAIILGDVEAAALGTEQLQQLAQAVEAGKGLMAIGGLHSFGRGQYHKTALNEVLPIKIDPLEGSTFAKEDPDEFFLDGPLTAVPTRPAHPITQLASLEQNQTLWLKLPPLPWSYKFAGVKNAPGVRVLLETTKGVPLMVSGEYGRGRVLVSGAPGTYLWPMHGYEAEHKRFWRQIILWLVRREELDKSEVWTRLEQRRFQPGSKVEVRAGVRTATGDPLATASLDVILLQPNGNRVAVRMNRERDEFRGQVIVEQPGNYVLETTGRNEGNVIGSVRTEFLVVDRDIELSNPAADADHLAALAAATHEYGGRVLVPEQLAEAILEVANRPPSYEVRQTRWRLAAGAGEAWLMYLALVGLFASEWYLRKRWGLV